MVYSKDHSYFVCVDVVLIKNILCISSVKNVFATKFPSILIKELKIFV